MKKIVVTGGAGFIGSHTATRLLSEGCEVRVIDNLSTGRLANLEHVKSDPNLRVFEADINEVQAEAYEGADAVIHLAALADIVPSIERPIDYHRANVDGTVSVLEQARRAGIERLVYAASSSCYGLADIIPTPETAPISPQYPYALTKNLGEQCVLHWAKIYQMTNISLRFFNVFGPRSRTSGTYGAVFGVFLAQKLANRPFTVVGDGTQTRDFVYVSDVVDAILLSLKSPKSGVYNVGASKPQSVKRLVELLGGEVTYVPKRPGEPDVTHADIRKIRNDLGWRPKTSFDEGVKIMLANIDYWKEAPVWDPSSIQEATKDWFRYLK